MKIVVTGACGQLGKAFCEVFNAMDVELIGVDYLEKPAYLSEDQFHQLDICDTHSVECFFQKNSDIDCLVNNAGIGVFSPTQERTHEEFNSVMQVNLWGTFLMSNTYVKVKKTEGRVINIASMYGHQSSDFRIYGNSNRNNSEVYTATKAGVIALTKYLAVHYAKDQFTFNSVSPGGVMRQQSEDFLQNYKLKNPQERLAKDDEIASVVKFLAVEAPRHLNGEDILVDGGFTKW